ncbi:hypothetical protein, partial [Microbacterium terregens]|uniref:hypothetical protein n=1 Tax=Microbacterium terregens TaxID=69363 RepID=UPI0031D82156
MIRGEVRLQEIAPFVDGREQPVDVSATRSAMCTGDTLSRSSQRRGIHHAPSRVEVGGRLDPDLLVHQPV